MTRLTIVIPLVAFTVFSLQSVAMSQPEPEEARRTPESEVKPDLMGLPYDEAIELVTRRTAALRHLPGFEAVSVGVDAIYVYTDRADLLPATLEGIPVKPLPPMRPRLQGRPHAEVDAILVRAQRDLEDLPGVQEMGLDAEGIYVYTDQPELIPEKIEGLPVKTLPFMGPSINQ